MRSQTAYTTSLNSGESLFVMENRSLNAYYNGVVGELALTRSIDNRVGQYAYLAAKWGVA